MCHNPLKYTDPSGEIYKWNELVGAYVDEWGHVIQESDVWKYENGFSANDDRKDDWDLGGSDAYRNGYYYYNSYTNQIRYVQGTGPSTITLFTVNLSPKKEYAFLGGPGNDWMGRAVEAASFTTGAAGMLNNIRNFIEWEYVKEARLNRARGGNFSQPIKHSLRTIKNTGRALTVSSGALLAIDIALSGEVKPSHWIDAGMVGLFFTGWGTPIGGVWFIADYGTMGVNLILGKGAMGLGGMIDNSDWGKDRTIKMYEGIY